MKFLNNVDVNDNDVIYSNALTASQELSISSTSTTEIYSFPISSYRGAKFIVVVSISGDYSIRELLALHDGSNGYITEYAIVSSGTESVDDQFSFSIFGAAAQLTITPSTSTARVVKVFTTLIE